MNTINNYCLICFLIFCQINFINLKAQSDEIRFHINGKIIDARTQKPIKRVPLTVMPFNRVVDADSKGGFHFNMPFGDYSVVIDYPPFERKEVKFHVAADTTFVIALNSPFATTVIEEVEVTASKSAIETASSINQVSAHMLKVMPTIIGERDVLKVFALTAGVSSSAEGTADIQVRGGVQGQNLFLLDGIPMYSTQHFFGLVSAYNPTIIKSATLYKSNFPAEFGGKISSVVNVITEEATTNKLHGEAETGLLTSKIGLNIPLAKDKLALALAGRISNYSVLNLISIVLPESSGLKFGLYFGDLNSNLSWKISEKDRLKLTYFNNGDVISFLNKEKGMSTNVWIQNAQQNLGLNWYRKVTDKLENHLLGYVDKYSFQFGNMTKSTSFEAIDRVEKTTSISSFGLTDKLTIQQSEKLKFSSGMMLKAYQFQPLNISLTNSESNLSKSAANIHRVESALFTELEAHLANKQVLTTGVRLSAMGDADRLYPFIEPRVGYHGIFDNNFSISASAGRMTQPIHRVANAGLGFPFEMFVPSGIDIQPESSWNYSLGGGKDLEWKKRKLSFKTDFWYKTLENVVEFKDGFDAMYTQLIFQDNSGSTPSNIVTQGKGKAFGIDVSAAYSHKKLSLTADYTLMKAIYQFAELNRGLAFAAPTDMRHTLAVTGEFLLSDEWSFVITWQYHSGKPITVPTEVYQKPSISIEGIYGSSIKRIESERNNYRMRDFHKLDISFAHKYKAFKKYDGTFTVGLYNAYNQANPYFYFIDTVRNSDLSYTPVLKSLSIFPVLPSLNWLVKF